MKQLLVIMQGPPGSGKSTFAKRIADSLNAIIRSTDDLRYVNGVYVFLKEESGKFHKRNQNLVHCNLLHGSSVIVDNTNIKRWEARPYVEMAVELNIPIIFIRCSGNYSNIHEVSQEQVDKMYAQMEDLTVESCLAAQYPWEQKPVDAYMELMKD